MSPQGRYWFLTLATWLHPDQPKAKGFCCYVKGQKEEGEGGYLHWQFVAVFSKPVRRKGILEIFPGAHAELTISQEGSEAYVFKDDTRVPGSQFEDGARKTKRNSSYDWDAIWLAAINGNIMDIPADIRFRNYGTIRRIIADNADPVDMDRRTRVYWGPTATGKSYTARQEAGDYYIKNPNTKWWCGYKGQRNVVIDEFRGRIDVSYFLLWCDNYKCTVETKGGSVPFCATNIWICSNLDPRNWWPELDTESKDAILRRFDITHFQAPFRRVRS